MNIKTAVLNGVFTVEIARPEKKNALTMAMYQAMAEAFRAAVADPAVRAVLVSGQPGIFTSGNDLEDFMQRPPQGLDSPVFQCMQALLPSMTAGGFGRIVNMSSRAALGKELRTAYAATKAGLIGMTRVWALELGRHGITVNAIGPGPIRTELFDRANPPDSPRTRAIVESVPVKRVGTPEDVAQAVSFFLDRRSGFVTGQTLYVCGGMTVGVAGV